jgi:hypothetical protein
MWKHIERDLATSVLCDESPGDEDNLNDLVRKYNSVYSLRR